MTAASDGPLAEPGPVEGRLDPVAARDALTRVLTLESRNALSRVELAASELSRLETNPATASRIAAIRDAVGELDVLLEKLGLLWTFRARREARVVDLDALVEAVCGRLTPTLQARGIRIQPGSGVGRCRLGVSPVVLERLLFCFLRRGLSCLRGEHRLGIETRVEGTGIAVVLRGSEGWPAVRPSSADRERRLDLELQLAELDGRLLDPGEAETLAFWIPGQSEVDP